MGEVAPSLRVLAHDGAERERARPLRRDAHPTAPVEGREGARRRRHLSGEKSREPALQPSLQVQERARLFEHGGSNSVEGGQIFPHEVRIFEAGDLEPLLQELRKLCLGRRLREQRRDGRAERRDVTELALTRQLQERCARWSAEHAVREKGGHLVVGELELLLCRVRPDLGAVEKVGRIQETSQHRAETGARVLEHRRKSLLRRRRAC